MVTSAGSVITCVWLLASFAAARPADPPGGDARSKLSAVLRRTVGDQTKIAGPIGAARARLAARASQSPLVRISPVGELQVYIAVDDCGAELRGALADLGARIVRSDCDLGIVEAFVFADRLVGVAAHGAVRSVRSVERPVLDVGSVTTEGDAILGADLVRALGHDGTGVKIGVLSDDVDNLAEAQASGDLPANVTVLQTTLEVGDEGTAMLEIVHDLAPGADLYFYSGWNSDLDMRDGILALADSGCQVIVDDISYLSQPFFEDGFLAEAVEEVAGRGVVYCASAGNFARKHYEADYVSAMGDTGWHAWDGVSDSTLTLEVGPGQTLALYLQWDDPYGASANDYDLYLYSDAALQTEVAHSYAPQSGTHYPRETIIHTNGTGSLETLYLAIDLFSGVQRRLELYVFGAAGPPEWVTREGSVFGHSAATGAVAVAAIDVIDQGHDDVAAYSSWGPSRISHPAAEVRAKPDISAMAGVSVTGAGNFPTAFYGTSAAAPHVAAIAALLIDAHPDWTRAEVLDAMKSTAVDLGAPGADYAFGAGRVQADAAVAVARVGPTNVSGDVATMTWSLDRSPYRVQAVTRVIAGHTLTIESGVDVLFDVDARFVVEGRLQAVGTPSDSIRFIKGAADEWGGLRFVGADNSALTYARISGGRADGSGADALGSAAYVSAAAVSLRHCVVAGNADPTGNAGVLSVVGGGRLLMKHSAVRRNDGLGLLVSAATADLDSCEVVGSTHGGIRLSDGSLTLNRSVVAGNDGGGIRNDFGYLTATNSTIAYNTGAAPTGISGDGATTITNTIVWGNGVEGDLTATYSDIEGSWPGVGNLDAAPLFVDQVGGDYRLNWNSPCIDTGDPIGPPDADGSDADMGAFSFDHSEFVDELALPVVSALAGDSVTVSVRGTFSAARSIDLAFVVDNSIMVPNMPLVRSHAYVGLPNALALSSVNGDTVRVSLSSDTPASLLDTVLVELAFDVRPDVPGGATAPIEWLPFPHTRVAGRLAEVVNGQLTVLEPPILYGDASADGSVTAFDASRILRYVVALDETIDHAAADVTGDGGVSGYDAALVLRRAVDPAYVFPAEGSGLPKPAEMAARRLRWEARDEAMVLIVDDPEGIRGVDLIVSLETDSPVSVRGSEYLAYSSDGRTLRVSMARQLDGGTELLRVEARGPMRSAPEIVSVRLNEGRLRVEHEPVPRYLELGANTPNPFNPTTKIAFALPTAGDVRLVVYTTAGQVVRVLFDGAAPMGYHSVAWDGRDARGRAVASGAYVYRLVSDGKSLTRKMLLVR